MDQCNIPSLEVAPSVILAPNEEIRRVTCPHCLIGFAEVKVVTQGKDHKTVANIRDPRRCLTCKREFRIRPRIVLEGVPLEA